MIADQAMTLEVRVKRLERRSHIGWGAAGVMACALLLAMRSSPSSELRTKQLVIEDDAGRSRIVLAAPFTRVDGRKRTDPASGMLVLDEHGVDRVVIGSPTTNPQVQGRIVDRVSASSGITFNDKHGTERGGFGVLDGDDRVVLGLDHETGEGVVLFIDNQFSGLLINSADEGGHRQRVFLGIGGDKQATSVFNLDDGKGQRRFQIMAPPDAQPTLHLYDHNAQPIVSLPETSATADDEASE